MSARVTAGIAGTNLVSARKVNCQQKGDDLVRKATEKWI
jgi:hypothetical protein